MSCLDESENRHWNHSPIPSGIGAITAPSPIIRSLAPRYSSAFASSSPASSTAPPLHRAAPPPPSPAPPRRSPPPPNPAPPRQSPPPPSLALLPSTHESPRRPTPASCSSLLRRRAKLPVSSMGGESGRRSPPPTHLPRGRRPSSSSSRPAPLLFLTAGALPLLPPVRRAASSFLRPVKRAAR